MSDDPKVYPHDESLFLQGLVNRFGGAESIQPFFFEQINDYTFVYETKTGPIIHYFNRKNKANFSIESVEVGHGLDMETATENFIAVHEQPQSEISTKFGVALNPTSGFDTDFSVRELEGVLEQLTHLGFKHELCTIRTDTTKNSGHEICAAFLTSHHPDKTTIHASTAISCRYGEGIKMAVINMIAQLTSVIERRGE